MDYEKKYKEAFAHAREIHRNEIEKRRDMEFIFPELAESEDEKIRGAIIDHLKDNNLTEWAAWLEKQGEKKPVINGILTATNYDKMFQNCNVHKFNVGDWIIFNGITLYIEDIVPSYYKTISVNGISQSYEWNIDKFSRLWTIQDAKDGDMLISQSNKPFIYNGNYESFFVGSHCGISAENKFRVSIEKCHWTENRNIHPATKEQCNILFSKMKEAGYEWNTEKKELKEIKQKWSEEDEENMKKILDAIGSYYYLTTDDDILCDWLKKRLLSNDKNL